MQHVYTAYRKLKTYVYYDNSNLLMRNQLAEFENRYFTNCNDKDDFKKAFKEKFNPLLKTINGKANDKGTFFDELLKEISYWLIPKKIEAQHNWKGKERFITNSIPSGKFQVKDFNILINAPIELHVLSVLWVMVVGKKINRYICTDNYAYKLSLYQQNNGKSIDGDNSGSLKLDRGLRLFEPYYKGYQMWRDKALDKALEGLDEKKDAVILSLDITKYYYSARLNVEMGLKHFLCATNHSIQDDIFNTLDKTLNSLLHRIHKTYALKIERHINSLDCHKNSKDAYPLPVGLLSSGVLANLYLKDFDEYVNDTITPSYYGRYVDDILMVFIGKKVDLENVEGDGPISSFIKKHIVRENHPLDCQELKDSLTNGTSTNTNNIPENGHIYVFNSKKEENDDEDFCFCIKAPDSELIIKNDKVVMEYFKPHESRAAINNFRKRLQQNSSEYRLLPFEYEVDKEFDEEAFKLDLKEYDSKLRSLQGINEDRYGASKYLAHKIFLSILPFDPDEKDKRYKDTSAEQILTYFRGHNSLCMFTLWEKVATYFLVNNDMTGLWKFYSQQLEAIENIEYAGKDDDKDKIWLELQLKDNLRQTLFIGIAMAFSLDPSKIKSFDYRKLSLIKDPNIEDTAQKFRHSFMFRHQYQYLRGLCFTQNSLNNTSSILGKDVLNKKIDSICENGLAKYLSPVFLRFENIALIKYYNQLGEMANENSK